MNHFDRLENLLLRVQRSQAKLERFLHAIGIPLAQRQALRARFERNVLQRINKVFDEAARAQTGLQMEAALAELNALTQPATSWGRRQPYTVLEGLLRDEAAAQMRVLRANADGVQAAFRAQAGALGAGADAFARDRFSDCSAMLQGLAAEQSAVVTEAVASQRQFLGDGPGLVVGIQAWRAGVAAEMAPYDQSFVRMRDAVRAVRDGAGAQVYTVEVDELLGEQAIAVGHAPAALPVEANAELRHVEEAYDPYTCGVGYLEACLSADSGFAPLRAYLAADFEQLNNRLSILGTLEQQYRHLLEDYRADGTRHGAVRMIDVNGVEVRVDLANAESVQQALGIILGQINAQQGVVYGLVRDIYHRIDQVREAAPGGAGVNRVKRDMLADLRAQGLSAVATQAKLDRMIGTQAGAVLYAAPADAVAHPEGYVLQRAAGGPDPEIGQACVMSVAMREFDRHFRTYQQRLDLFARPVLGAEANPDARVRHANAIAQVTARVQLGRAGFYRFYAAAAAGPALNIPGTARPPHHGAEQAAGGVAHGFVGCDGWQPVVAVGPGVLHNPPVGQAFQVDEPNFTRLEQVDASIAELRQRMSAFMTMMGLRPQDLHRAFERSREPLDVLLSAEARARAGVSIDRLLARLDTTANFMGRIGDDIDAQLRLVERNERAVKAQMRRQAIGPPAIDLGGVTIDDWVDARYADCRAMMRSFCEEQRELFRQAHREQRLYLGAPEFDYSHVIVAAGGLPQGAQRDDGHGQALLRPQELRARRRIAERGLVSCDRGFSLLCVELERGFDGELVTME